MDKSGLPSRISALPNAQPAAQDVRLGPGAGGNFLRFRRATKLPRLRPHAVHITCACIPTGYPQSDVDNFLRGWLAIGLFPDAMHVVENVRGRDLRRGPAGWATVHPRFAK